MGSQEQMGELLEQSQMKPAGDKGGIPENPASPAYDEVKWKTLMEGGAAFAIKKGKEMGVSPEELDRYARGVIAQGINDNQLGFVYRFRKNMKIGTEEEVKNAGEQAYRLFLERDDPGSAISIAEEVYGKDSAEWRCAHQAIEAKWKQSEKRRKRREKKEGRQPELRVTISRDATFADLFNAIDAIEEHEGLDKFRFYEELLDNFGPDIAAEVLNFRGQTDETTTTIVDFFKKRGYSQKDITVFLPIKFKRKEMKN